MPRLLRDKRVFVIAVLCGTLISASDYLKPLSMSEGAIMFLLRPISLLSVLNVLPETLVSRIIWEPLQLPAWLGKALVFLYWPVLGAVVGVCRHWLPWSVVALGIHIGFLVLIFSELSQGKLMF
jgi:hypothetical protein